MFLNNFAVFNYDYNISRTHQIIIKVKIVYVAKYSMFYRSIEAINGQGMSRLLNSI